MKETWPITYYGEQSGVARAVEDIITVLTTDSADWQKKPELRAEDNASSLDAITPFVPTYDGRKQEPVVLPARIPLDFEMDGSGRRSHSPRS